MQKVAIPSSVGSFIQKRYTITDMLGENASGSVYLVSEKERGHSQNQYVLKEVMVPDRKEQYSFPYKERILKNLHHPALPHIYRVFWNKKHDRVYILTGYILGDTLEVLQQQLPDKRMSLSQALAAISPIVNAVGYLHQQRTPLVHGNIKPSNIVVPKASGAPVLVNLGGIKEYKSATTPSLESMSNYLAPEQLRGRASIHSDIYALGAILYTLLTGMAPPSASDRVKQTEQKEPDPLIPVNQIVPSVHSIVAQVIHHAMAIHSFERFSSVEKFWEALWQMILVNPTQNQLSLLTTDGPIEEVKSQAEISTSTAEHPSLVPPLSEGITELDDSPTIRRPRPFKVILPEIMMTSVSSAVQEDKVSLAVMPSEAPLTPLPPSLMNDKHSANTQGKSFFHRLKKLRLRLFMLLGIALLLSIALCSGLWLFTVEHRVPTTSVLSSGHQLKGTLQPSTHPTSIVKVTSNPVSSPFPNIARPYNGTIFDISGSVKTNMSLTGIQQQQGSFSGNFSGLGRENLFSGTINTTGHILFTVVGKGQEGTISFSGSMQANGNLVGNYCKPSQAEQCSDYGLWSVSPTS